MKRSRYNVVINQDFGRGDPRRREPPRNSIKRIGEGWRERWHATLDSRYFKEEGKKAGK